MLEAKRRAAPTLVQELSPSIYHDTQSRNPFTGDSPPSPNLADSTVLERLGDDLDEFAHIVQKNVTIFPPEEGELLRNNLAMMQTDIRLQHQYILDSSHHGAPSIVAIERTGGRGRPRIAIDPTFLQWAYNMRSTSGIAQFLGVSRARVRNALLEYGIATPQENPFPPHTQDPTPLGEHPESNLPQDLGGEHPAVDPVL
ncbi:hypothetical protein OF83DRAFT_1089059, partial [Amylostereum chailletii]